MKPAYLRKIDTGECFAYSEHLVARGDMVAWTGPLPWEKKITNGGASGLTLLENTAKANGQAITIPEAPVAAPEKPQDEPKEEKQGYACTECDFVAKNSGGLRLHKRNKH